MIKMENTSVGQRFVQLIAHLGISKNAFAVSLDKTATVIQHLVEERNKPGFDLLCKVFEVYPSVSKDWLLQGRGPMLNTEVHPGGAPIMATAKAAAAATTTRTAAPILEPAPAVPSEPAKPAPIPEPAPVIPPVTPSVAAVATPAPAPAAAPEAAWQTALYTQQMAHQLAIAEMRNQHLQDQQRLMQQMMDLMQRKLM